MSYTKSWTENVYFHRNYVRNGITTPSTVVRSFPATRSGTKLPDWRTRVKKRENATTPYTLDATKMSKLTDGIYSVTGVYGAGSGQSISQSFEGTGSVPSPVVTHLLPSTVKANSIALAALYRKVDAQISQVNVPATLIEFGDVIRQFGSPFRSILALTERHLNRLYLQRRDIHALRYNKIKLSKVLADTYLEYAFGLAPLINDTKKVAEALARWHWEVDPSKTRPPPIKLVGRGSDSLSTTALTQQSVPIGAAGDVLNLKRQYTIATEARCQYVCGYDTFLTADYGSLDRLNQLLGFRPEKWIPAVWEGVPWSWLVDYFTNVQDILDSVAASKVQPSWISKTVTTVTEISTAESIDTYNTFRMAANNGWRNVAINSKPGLAICRRTTMQRSIPPSLGLPTVYYQLPDSMRQLANMSAVLLAQQKSPPMISLETNYRSFLRQH